MGMFTKGQEEKANNVYEEIQRYLKPKDGKKHVVLINSFCKAVSKKFECEDKYTTQIDTVLINMQNYGYEIIDIKLECMPNQTISGQMFRTLIIYK